MKKKIESPNLRKLKDHIKGHNKFLTDSTLKTFSPMVLLANAHPIYRLDFARQLKEDGIIKEADEKEIINHQKIQQEQWKRKNS